MGSTLAQLAPYYSSSKTVEVDAVSLEDACGELGSPRFIKLDIEGSEKQVVGEAVEFTQNRHRLEYRSKSYGRRPVDLLGHGTALF